MRALILGSGVIGVTTAYALHKAGWQVTVIDRQPQAAMETSHANGGQLSFSHVEPWASPSILRKLPRWLLQKHSPVACKPGLDGQAWRWAGHFLRQACSPGQTEQTARKLLHFTLHSRDMLQEIMEETGIRFAYRQSGTLHPYFSRRQLGRAESMAQLQATSGCDYYLLDRRATLEKEPALAHTRQKLAGAIYFPMDASGDVCRFTQQLQGWLTARGVTFRFGTHIHAIEQQSGRLTGIRTHDGLQEADLAVLALGSHSRHFLPDLGIDAPLYPLKGYSITLAAPEGQAEALPVCALTDNCRKLVFSRLGSRLRVAGLAELGDSSATVHPHRIAQIRRAVADWFPQLAEQPLLSAWSGLRPATPSGLPIVGHTAVEGVLVNTGHGTLGWTLAAGSADRIANLAGQAPQARAVQHQSTRQDNIPVKQAKKVVEAA